MARCLYILLVIAAFAFSAFSQEQEVTAPIKWQNYALGKDDLSVSLPKLPVRADYVEFCSDLKVLDLSAYADDAGYQVIFVTKSLSRISESCTEKVLLGPETLNKRLESLRADDTTITPFSPQKSGWRVAKVETRSRTQWIYDDLKNNRWIEMSVTRLAKDADTDRDFFESLSITKKALDIGSGSPVTIGDEAVKQPVATESIKKVTSEIAIITKPRPPYTDAARYANTEGTVMLRVTFLANGSVGAISPVKELKYGLTENAIAAARKIVFLPKKVEGINITVTKIVEYSFRIY